MATCEFYLGTHQPSWLTQTGVPLFVSARRLRSDRGGRPLAAGPWSLDSGGFTELSLNGRWTVPAERYASEVVRWAKDVGRLRWAAIQDWMCEPHIVAKTGLSVREHQLRTVASYLRLNDLAPNVWWIPVLQGFATDDYLRHADDYLAAGVDLHALPLVGLGSVCRRQATGEVEGLIRRLTGDGLRLHGFGFALPGLRRVGRLLASADSLAWSAAARREPPIPGHAARHRRCNNCIDFALAWRWRVVESLRRLTG